MNFYFCISIKHLKIKALKKIQNALISVFHKDRLEPIIQELNHLGVTIYSTGGTQKFIEDITTPKDKYRLIRKYHTRCCDSIIWDYEGACRYLEWLDKNIDYSVPNDYVMINFFENNIDISHYWSINEFFRQGSNLGLVERVY